MAKRRNPETSKLAYDSVRDHVIPNHHQKIMAALAKNGGEGIYEEIAGWCGFKDRNACSRRLLEMLNLGKIEKTDRKKPTSTGRQAFIYRLPAPKPSQKQSFQPSLF